MAQSSRKTEGIYRIIFCVFPVLLLADSLESGILLAVTFLVTSLFIIPSKLIKKTRLPPVFASALSLIAIAAVLSGCLVALRVVDPGLFARAFVKVSVIAFIPWFLDSIFDANPERHLDDTLVRLLESLAISVGIALFGIVRHLLASLTFSPPSVAGTGKGLLPVFALPAGAFFLLAFLMIVYKLLRKGQGSGND